MKVMAYASDLTDAEWQRIALFIPPARPGGRPRCQDMRAVLDAICFYMAHHGRGWRALPDDLPPWQTVYYYYRCWQRDGTLDRIQGALWRASACEVGRAVESERRRSTLLSSAQWCYRCRSRPSLDGLFKQLLG
jgi:putative transposase